MNSELRANSSAAITVASSVTDGDAYDLRAKEDTQRWREEMLRGPGLFSWVTGRVQSKINALIPEKAHVAMTAVVKQMTRAVLAGSEFVAPDPLLEGSLAAREFYIQQKIEGYRTVAAVEGGITGAGGFFMGIADFPLLLGIKLKMLFDMAALYGHSCADFRERLYLLQVFQLAFSGKEHRRRIFLQVERWRENATQLPASFDEFDWRTYQQEYRDYIDLAKMAQLIPVVGAPVGAVVNYRLVNQLGETAKYAYRLRRFAARAS